MEASIAHTMMGPGLGENGCVLWVNEKKINSIFWGFMKIVSKILWFIMVYDYSFVGRNDRPRAVGATADCSGRMTQAGLTLLPLA